MSVYDHRPARFLEVIHDAPLGTPPSQICCAGFAMKKWRCAPFSNHLVEWLPDYALAEDELRFTHADAFVKLQQAAVRVYTSSKYKKRGEAGEIALHAICREFFGTIPIAPRVFYKSSSNDPIKSFDLVHARFPTNDAFEIWLGESKLFANRTRAIGEAIKSIKTHIAEGFLTREKLLLGPQISKSTPHHDRIADVFRTQTSLDVFLSRSVFVIGILANSPGTKKATERCDAYVADAVSELGDLLQKLAAGKLPAPLKIVLVYVPLASKEELVTEFDKRLKGLQ